MPSRRRPERQSKSPRRPNLPKLPKKAALGIFIERIGQSKKGTIDPKKVAKELGKQGHSVAVSKVISAILAYNRNAPSLGRKPIKFLRTASAIIRKKSDRLAIAYAERRLANEGKISGAERRWGYIRFGRNE